MVISRNKKVFGVGINDLDIEVLRQDGKLRKSHQVWYNMLSRCYNSDKSNMPTYKGCTVCEEWLRLSSFSEWFSQHYVEDWQLDKDILFKGNKHYSPMTCCFVPRDINSMLTRHGRGRGAYPIGVYYKNNGWQRKFIAALNIDGRRRGIGSFFTPEEAFEAYKIAKEAEIKKLANRYKDTLEQRVYEALCNYKVEITD